MRPIKPTEERWDILACAAYSAYSETRQWKSFNGDPLPQWPAVKPEIKAGWVAAVKGVLGSLNNRCARCFEPLEHKHTIISTVVDPTLCPACGHDAEGYQ